MKEKRNIITRKIQLFPVGDKDEVNRVYKYLHDGMFNQNKAMNQYISALYVSTIQGISADDRKELNRLYTRISSSKKGSAYQDDISFPTGLPVTASLGQKVKQDFSTFCKKGGLYGKISLPSYRMDNPMLVHVDYVRLKSKSLQGKGLYHNYENRETFINKLYDKDLELFIDFANNITFKIELGQPHKSAELRSVFKNIFDEVYDVRGSTIEIDGTKIILNMSISIPRRDAKLDENTVVGVDLGIAIPAQCGLNNSKLINKSIGCANDFLRVRTKLQAQRKRLQKALVQTSGGHGRNKKLKHLDMMEKHEANWVQNYNHFVSKSVIDFALQNNAKYINLENLKGYKDNGKDEEEKKKNKKKFILRNWSYYQLQEYITYKAQQYGIEVRKINPAYTSQICSCCGNLEEGQRINQEDFRCKKCGAELNADFNASRNIAMSTDFVEE